MPRAATRVLTKGAFAKLEALLRPHFMAAGPDHDWWHVLRVRGLALEIARELLDKGKQTPDLFIVELGALLHDVLDEKLSRRGNRSRLLHEVRSVLSLQPNVWERVLPILTHTSFGSSLDGNHTEFSLEAAIVSDADKLDAMGAMGVARCLAYSGRKGQALYDPGIPVRRNFTLQSYRRQPSTALNHFEEKLLKLLAMLHTAPARRMGRRRHGMLLSYRRAFLEEWDLALGSGASARL